MALTVGVQTVMDAREVVLVITGQNKALALSQMIEGGVNHMVRSMRMEYAGIKLTSVDHRFRIAVSPLGSCSLRVSLVAFP
jgi:hypothetical protein